MIWGEIEGKTGNMIVRKVPESLRRQFKSKCAAEGISQQDKIIELMREYVSK
jgi:plasmid stability protein